jgi:hypothetical protein
VRIVSLRLWNLFTCLAMGAAAGCATAGGLSATGTDCGVTANVHALAGEPGFRLAPDYVGLTLARAGVLANGSHLTVREVGHDGHCVVVTEDARTDRVNVYLVQDHVRVAAIY